MPIQSGKQLPYLHVNSHVIPLYRSGIILSSMRRGAGSDLLLMHGLPCEGVVFAAVHSPRLIANPQWTNSSTKMPAATQSTSAMIWLRLMT
jgi:hypothetical protein